jgi:hypothetical protein
MAQKQSQKRVELGLLVKINDASVDHLRAVDASEALVALASGGCVVQVAMTRARERCTWVGELRRQSREHPVLSIIENTDTTATTAPPMTVVALEEPCRHEDDRERHGFRHPVVRISRRIAVAGGQRRGGQRGGHEMLLLLRPLSGFQYVRAQEVVSRAARFIPVLENPLRFHRHGVRNLADAAN